MQSLSADLVHYTWSPTHPPRLRIQPGETIEAWIRDGFDGQMGFVADGDLDESMKRLDFGRMAPLTGPVFLEGSRPGDIAVVRIDVLEPIGSGWTVIWPGWSESEYVRPPTVGPGAAILRFPEKDLLSGVARIGPIEVALRPMLGIIGTAPARGEFVTLPPRAFGGNMDLRLVAAGSTVYLPIFVDGALLSFGDGHAVQGDGEVCGTGLECSMRAVVTVDLEQHRSIPEPEVQTQDSYMVTARGKTLDEAATKAILYMHRYLTEVREVNPIDAFALMSLVGDLAVNQVVDSPYVGVRFSVPLSALATNDVRLHQRASGLELRW